MFWRQIQNHEQHQEKGSVSQQKTGKEAKSKIHDSKTDLLEGTF